MRERLDRFVTEWKKMAIEFYTARNWEARPEFEVTDGKRYWKIIMKDGNSRSVRAFVDKTTGDILKPASWAAPAKHARGSILAEDFGMSCLEGPYGPKYLK